VSAVCVQKLAADLVELKRGHAGPGSSHHLAQCLGANSTDGLKGLDISL
jgi:hypothetical protein